MENEKKTVNLQELAEFCMQVANDRKAENVISLQMTGTTLPADYFILCTGNSEPHLQAIADRIGREVKTTFGIRPRATEGTAASHWMLLDYGFVVVHVMTAEMREMYQLESLWGDAPRQEALDVLTRGPGSGK